MQRISVVGVPGSGKSTVGRALATAIDAPFTELDSVFHQAGWTPLPVPEYRSAVADLVSEDRWVIDGNYTAVRDLVWDRADTIVWLDPPRIAATARVLRRTLRRVTRREDLWNGNRERWSNLLSAEPERNVVLWSWVKHPLYRELYGESMVDPALEHAEWIRLRSDEQIEVMVRDAGGRAPSTGDEDGWWS